MAKPKGASGKKAKETSVAKGDGKVIHRCTICDKVEESLTKLDLHFKKCKKAKEESDKVNREREINQCRETEQAANRTRTDRRTN